MIDKKGDVTIGTLVAIILGIVVLVFIIVGFTGGWNNFMEKMNIFSGSKNNIADYETACQQACLMGSQYDFCEKILPLFYEKGYKIKEGETYTCNRISKEKVIFENVSDASDTKNITMNVNPCPTITCPQSDQEE